MLYGNNYKNIYLVDYENVGNPGLDGINTLSKYDKVIVFYSQNANTIQIDLVNQAILNDVKLKFIKTTLNGPNSLDFQLMTYMGLIAKENKNSKIIIVSYDKDFQVSIELLNSIGYNTCQQISISNEKKPTEFKVTKDIIEKYTPEKYHKFIVSQDLVSQLNKLISNKSFKQCTKNQKTKKIDVKIRSFAGQKISTLKLTESKRKEALSQISNNLTNYIVGMTQ